MFDIESHSIFRTIACKQYIIYSYSVVYTSLFLFFPISVSVSTPSLVSVSKWCSTHSL